MDSNTELSIIASGKMTDHINILKRKTDDNSETEHNKKKKVQTEPKSSTVIKKGTNNIETQIIKKSPEEAIRKGERQSLDVPNKIPSSPKKRLRLSVSADVKKSCKEKFIYGNYSQYYGYRNKDMHYDIRLDVFAKQKHIFEGAYVLDIGCNSGFITTEVAKQFDVKSIVGLDIDKSLINQGNKNLIKLKKSLPMENEFKRFHKFPFNITFVHGNYVLKDDVLLEIERAQFDVILCLSLTKWIQLNFGDSGIKQAFKRMFAQLQPQGKLILEAQPFDNYGRRKKMTDTIYKNFKDIQFFPKDFTQYLLSSDVGFSKVALMGVPDHCTRGFKRPINIFFKS